MRSFDDVLPKYHVYMSEMMKQRISIRVVLVDVQLKQVEVNRSNYAHAAVYFSLKILISTRVSKQRQYTMLPAFISLVY